MIVGERRFQYEAEVNRNALNYDAWFDYIRLEENAGDHDKVREVGGTTACSIFPCSSDTAVLCACSTRGKLHVAKACLEDRNRLPGMLCMQCMKFN